MNMRIEMQKTFKVRSKIDKKRVQSASRTKIKGRQMDKTKREPFGERK